jgi:hypothetical protein
MSESTASDPKAEDENWANTPPGRSKEKDWADTPPERSEEEEWADTPPPVDEWIEKSVTVNGTERKFWINRLNKYKTWIDPKRENFNELLENEKKKREEKKKKKRFGCWKIIR